MGSIPLGRANAIILSGRSLFAWPSVRNSCPINVVGSRQTLRDRVAVDPRDGGYGTLFDSAGRFNHIFEPWSGRTSWRCLSVSVLAATATESNALSDAFAVTPSEAIAPIVCMPGLTAHLVVQPDGARTVQRA